MRSWQCVARSLVLSLVLLVLLCTSFVYGQTTRIEKSANASVGGRSADLDGNQGIVGYNGKAHILQGPGWGQVKEFTGFGNSGPSVSLSGNR